MATSTLVGDFFATVDGAVVRFVSDGSTGLAAALASPFRILLALYVVLWGLAMMLGKIREPVGDGLLRVVRVTLVGALAINAGLYNAQIAQGVYRWPDELATVLSPGTGATSVNNVIDAALAKSEEVAFAIKEQASGWAPADALGWWLTSLAVAIFSAFVCLFAASFILLSKLGLGLLLAMGPLFIALALFRATERLFTAWVSQAATFALKFVLVSTSVALLFVLWQQTLDVALANAASGWTAFTPAFVIGGASLVLIWHASAIAAGLAGGVQISTMGVFAFASRGLRGGLRNTGRTADAMRPSSVRRSIRRLQQDGSVLRSLVRRTP